MVGKEKYFKILGIKPTHDQGLIKKAYRKQAFKYHPDKNKAPDAHYKFILITEAYETLSGQGATSKKQTNTYKPKTKEEILAEKITRAKQRWKKQQAEEEAKDQAYFKNIASGWKWIIFQTFAFYTAIFSTLLVIDYFLEGEKVCVTAEAYKNHLTRIIKVRDEKFYIGEKDYWFGETANSPIRGNYSYLFHDLKSVSIVLNYRSNYSVNSHSSIMSKYDHFNDWELYSAISFSSIYGAFPFIHFAFFIPVLLVLFKRPNLRFSIWRLVSIWIIYPTIIFFTFSNDRIFYLFELIIETLFK